MSQRVYLVPYTDKSDIVLSNIDPVTGKYFNTDSYSFRFWGLGGKNLSKLRKNFDNDRVNVGGWLVPNNKRSEVKKLVEEINNQHSSSSPALTASSSVSETLPVRNSSSTYESSPTRGTSPIYGSSPTYESSPIRGTSPIYGSSPIRVSSPTFGPLPKNLSEPFIVNSNNNNSIMRGNIKSQWEFLINTNTPQDSHDIYALDRLYGNDLVTLITYSNNNYYNVTNKTFGKKPESFSDNNFMVSSKTREELKNFIKYLNIKLIDPTIDSLRMIWIDILDNKLVFKHLMIIFLYVSH